MKLLHTTCLCLALVGVSGVAFAEDRIKCIGQDADGKDVHVTIDWDTGKMIVDGKVEKIIDTTKGKNGVATEDYKADDGRMVYDSVTADGENVTINQYESKGDKFIASVELVCKKIK